MDKKKKTLKRCVSVLLSLVICVSLMAPTFGGSLGTDISETISSSETDDTSEVSNSEDGAQVKVINIESEPIKDSGNSESSESDDGDTVITGDSNSEEPASDNNTTEYETEEGNTKEIDETETAESEDKTESENEIFSIDYDSFGNTCVYYFEPGTTVEEMIVSFPDEVEVTMTNGSIESVPIVWTPDEEDLKHYEENENPEEDIYIRFYMDFPEDYTLAYDNGDMNAVDPSEYPWNVVCVSQYAKYYTLGLGISPMIAGSLVMVTTEYGNGSNLITDTATGKNLSAHRLYTISGTGTVAFCAEHGAAAPESSITYTWTGEYANSSIAAILDEVFNGIYAGMTWNGYSYSPEQVRQVTQIAIYCFTNNWNKTSVSVDGIRDTNRTGAAETLALCKHLVNDIAPRGSSTQYAIYYPSNSSYQIMIVPTERE